MELDSPDLSFLIYNLIMIITIVVLVLDWLVLHANEQNLLKYHAIYITFLVVILHFHKQPYSYRIRGQKMLQKQKNDDKINKCIVCNEIKPARYYHCRRCDKCIYRMDHHCNWVGNCIGQYNSKVYLHLLFNLFFHSLIILIIIVLNYSYLLDTQRYEIYYLIIIIPILYSIFQSYRLITDFWICVKNNQTLIQSYKCVSGKKIAIIDNWRAYMGSNIIGWFIPYFQSNNHCDLLENTFSKSENEAKEYTYADEYMDGPDDLDEEAFFKDS